MQNTAVVILNMQTLVHALDAQVDSNMFREAELPVNRRVKFFDWWATVGSKL